MKHKKNILLIISILFLNPYFLYPKDNDLNTIDTTNQEQPDSAKDNKDETFQLINIFEKPQLDPFHQNKYYFDYLEQTSQEQTLFSYATLKRNKPTILKPYESNIDFKVDAETFWIGSSNQGLLNSCVDSDKAFYGQTIVNFPLNIKIPAGNHWGILEFNFTPCLNRLWGNFENEGVSESEVRIDYYVTETTHNHQGNLSPLFVRETWIKLYTQSDRSYFKVGAFPRKIGLGLILGNLYRVTGTVLTSSSERSVDQYRPGVEWHLKFGKRDIASINLYYSIYDDQALSLENQIEFTQSQKLDNCGNGPVFLRSKPTKPLMQVSHLLLLQSNIEIDFGKEIEKTLLVQPFLLYNRNKNEHVEYPSDAESCLVTIGSSFKISTPKVNGVIDCGYNLGSQFVKAWDRNGTIDINLSHQLAKINPSAVYTVSTTQPSPNISINYPNGGEFLQLDNLGVLVFWKNSYSRFRKCYKNHYHGWMLAADLGYEYNDNIKFGLIAGYASGDSNPNNDDATALLYRLRTDWDSVRLDYCKKYRGFYSVQPIYTGINVRSLQLLRSQRLNTPISGRTDITTNFFSNLVYGGLGLWYKKFFDRGLLSLNTNVIPMSMVSPLKFGFDPVFNDIKNTLNFDQNIDTTIRFLNHDKILPKYLGTEVNATIEFFAKNDLVFYFIVSVFLPGSYYHGIRKYSYLNQGKVIQLDAQGHSLSQDRSGLLDLQRYRITLLDDTAVYGIMGIKYLFNSESLIIGRK